MELPTSWTPEERLAHVTTLLGHILHTVSRTSAARGYAMTAYLIATWPANVLNMNERQLRKDLCAEHVGVS
jgi:hypothetical protein